MKFYYVYILQNRLKNFIYIGYSEDLKQRIISHNKGENKSTKFYLPLELIHYEAYRSMADAKRREKYLGVKNETELGAIFSKFPTDIKDTLDVVYENYMTKTAFELVTLTHSEKPWAETRKGLSATERSNRAISDDLIIRQYGQQA